MLLKHNHIGKVFEMVLKEGTAANLRTALASNSAYAEIKTLLDELDLAFDRIDVVTIEETVTVTNAVKDDLSTTIPAGASIVAVSANLDTTIVGDASGDNLLAKVGIGTSGDPDLLGLTADLVKNTKITKMVTPTPLASTTTIQVGAVKTDGSAATEKFVAGGKVSVKITYLIPKALPDVA